LSGCGARFDGSDCRIVREENLSSELIEFYEEQNGRVSRELMRIARMRRRRVELQSRWGAAKYEMVLGLYG
jgi:hypothetical protein